MGILSHVVVMLQIVGGTLRRYSDTGTDFVTVTTTAGTRGKLLPLGHKAHREMLEHRQLLLEFTSKNCW